LLVFGYTSVWPRYYHAKVDGAARSTWHA